MVIVFFFKGIVVGAIIAVPVGPVGVVCLRKTIFDGRLAGLVAGFGAASADALFGAIAAFGLTFISQWLLGYQVPLRIAGGCYLLYVGARAFFSLPPAMIGEHHDPETLMRGFVSTFMLSITNPITILAFLGIFAALGLGGTHATLPSAAVLVAGVWSGSLLWWLILSLGVGMFRRAIEPRQLSWISRGSSAILFASGAALLADTVVHFLSRLV